MNSEMKKEKIELLRTALCVTQKCTLKCKLCLAFIPYYKNPVDVTVNEAKQIFHKYFTLINKVKIFTITGGEPLLNSEIYHIMQLLFTYNTQITGSIDFVTNGTLDIPINLMELFEAKSDKIRVILSDYGNLSPKIVSISNELEKRGIPYRISNFHGENLYYDGWIDFRNHEQKIFTLEERNLQGKGCIHKRDKYFVIQDGELHNCSRSYYRMRIGAIPRIKGEYIDLLDDKISDIDKKEMLIKMHNNISVTSCAYCVGLKNGVERHYPAEQI